MRKRNTSLPFRPSRTPRGGFTLLELLLVLAILVVIGGIALPNFLGAGQEAKVNATKVQLDALKQSINLYQVRMNKLPATLEELRDGPGDAAAKSKWISPIITEIPTDAWENPLDFSVNGNTYEIRSAGMDGQRNTDDDITLEGSS
jgi:general secretion pathway protein G